MNIETLLSTQAAQAKPAMDSQGALQPGQATPQSKESTDSFGQAYANLIRSGQSASEQSSKALANNPPVIDVPAQAPTPSPDAPLVPESLAQQNPASKERPVAPTEIEPSLLPEAPLTEAQKPEKSHSADSKTSLVDSNAADILDLPISVATPVDVVTRTAAAPVALPSEHQPTELIRSVLSMAKPYNGSVRVTGDNGNVLASAAGVDAGSKLSDLEAVAKAPSFDTLSPLAVEVAVNAVLPKTQQAAPVMADASVTTSAPALTEKLAPAADPAALTADKPVPSAQAQQATLTSAVTPESAFNNAVQGQTVEQATSQVTGIGLARADSTAVPMKVDQTVMQSALEPENPEWGTQLGKHLVQMHLKGDQTMELKLHPAELGPLSVSIRVNDQAQAQVHFVSAHPQVRQALEQSMDQLRASLSNDGLSLAESSVSDHGQSSHRGSSDNSEGPGAWIADEGLSGSIREAGVDEKARAGVASDGSVDLYV